MEAFAIRVTTPDELFDEYSAEPIENRPLSDEVRDRILSAWIDTRDERPSHLSVEIDADQREEQLPAKIEEAIRYDFQETTEAARRMHVFTRSERREAVVAFLFLIGGPVPTTSTGRVGVFLLPLAVLIPLGMLALLRVPDRRGLHALLVIAILLAPVPATLKGQPHMIQRVVFMLPFMALQWAAVIILYFFPKIVLALPNHFFGTR